MRRSLGTFESLLWRNDSARVLNAAPAVCGEYLAKILTSQVYDVAHETSMQSATTLTSSLNNEIFLKREDTQPVFSFKIRGAYNKIANLPKDLLDKGVIACSAGNHAQGVALSARKLQIPATIVMPVATPSIKVKAVRRHGGEYTKVVLHGSTFDEASVEATRLMIEEGLTLIHPFDDPDVIAGQGTVGMEILRKFNAKPLDAIFVCTGGGGLLAGVAAAVKSLRPEVQVIGVEADDAAGMTTSLREGKVTTLSQVGLFADGAAVRTIGSNTFDICSKVVDGMITVSTDEICAAIKHGFNETRCVMEPAGALGIAGMIKFIKLNNWTDKTCVAITSGANIDFDRLRFVSERADSSEAMFSVTIPDRPGTFRDLYSLIHPRNVTEFSFRTRINSNGPMDANVIISFQAKSGTDIFDDKKEVAERLMSQGFKCTDLSDNELAKAHARHMSGGRAGLKEELLFRFEFPESPGALNKFLKTMDRHNDDKWNISLWHYRNCGHDVGRVLVGVEVRKEDRENFDVFLKNLNYKYHEETDNIIYEQFLL